MQVVRRPKFSGRARRLGSSLTLGCALTSLGWSAIALAAPPPPPPSNLPPPSDGAPTGRARQTQGANESNETPVVDQRTTSTDLTEAWGYSSSDGMRPNYVRNEREAGLAVNPIGYYQGVTVEGVNLPPYTPSEMGVQPVVLTWTGFERKPRSSRAFFQLSSGTAYQVDRQGFIISLRLPNTSVSVRNNARRLDTSYFRTPLTEVSLRKDGADLIITMELRREAAPSIQITEGQNGYKLLVVEFADTEAELPVESTTGPIDTSPAGNS